MTTAVNQPAPGAGPAGAGLPRLLPAAPEDLRAHLASYGPVPYRGHANLLIADVEASGLTGRGGAAFPVYRKLALVARAGPRQGRKVVVANGAESEPASRKDEMLLRLAPNLVLDGLQLAAEAVGATEAHLYLHDAPGPQILRALAERSSRGLDRLGVTITQAPPRFLAGQEAAVVNRLGGGPALPTFQPPRVSERGLGGAPTLVQNAETLAHLALIARYGPRWFRAVGTSDEPGSMLVTVYRPGARAHIREAAIGTPLRTLLGDGDGDGRGARRAGLAGRRLPRHLAADAGRGRDHAGQRVAAPVRRRRGRRRAGGAAVRPVRPGRGGAGDRLPGRRVGRPVRPVPERAAPHRGRAGRAGGLRPPPATLADLERWSGLVTGRGACHHPDGTVRFVRSALTVFEPEIRRHARGQCSLRPPTARRSCRCRTGCPPARKTGPRPMAEQLRVNPIQCTGHGVCAELLPELVTLDEWGYPIIDPRPVPPALDRDARRAVAACPTLALRLMRSEQPPVAFGLKNVVPRTGLDGHRRDRAQPARLVVLEGLDQLGAGVHDERPVGRHRLPDRLPAEQQDVHVRRGPGRERDRVPGPEHGQLAHLDRPLFRPDKTAAGQHVRERVELRGPRQPDLRPGRHGRVHQGDRRVRDPGAVMRPPNDPAITRSSAPPSAEDSSATCPARMSW